MTGDLGFFSNDMMWPTGVGNAITVMPSGGVHDDVNIQAGIDALASIGGGELRLVSGTYTCSASVNGAANVKVIGMGNSTIIQAATGLSDPLFVNNAKHHAEYHCMKLVADTNVTDSGIKTYNSEHVLITNIWAINFERAGIYLSGNNALPEQGTTVRSCRCEGCVTNANASGILIDNVDAARNDYNLIEDCYCDGNQFGIATITVGNNNLVSCRCSYNLWGFYLDDKTIATNCFGNHNTQYGFNIGGEQCVLSNGEAQANGRNGIWIHEDDCVVTGMQCYSNCYDNTHTWQDADICVYSCDHTIIENCNLGRQSPADYGVYIYGTSEKTQIKNNYIRGSVQPIYDGTGNGTSIIHDTKVDHFQDCLALDANHVVAAEDLSAGSPITCTLAAQPDVPRTLSWALTHANITEFSLEITGIDSTGRDRVETFTQADGWSGETDYAYATITTIVFTRTTGTGVGDTLDVGIADKLGLSAPVYESGDVYKVKEDNGDYTNYTFSATYGTVSIDGVIGAGNDYSIWFKSNYNDVA